MDDKAPKILKDNKYEIRGHKNVRGHDGQGFDTNLYRDGKKVAQVFDDGFGGGYQWTWVSKDEEKKFTNLVKTIPPYVGEDIPEPLEYDNDMALAPLIDVAENEKWLKRQCAKKTLFRLKGDKEGEYRTIKNPFDAKVKDYITNKYGKEVESIVNEQFA